MKPQIFVDLAGVLADWLTPALATMGCDPESVYAEWAQLDPRPWNVFDVVPMSANQGWKCINEAGEDFWANLPKFSHAHELMELCQSIGETTVLTTPSLEPSSYAGKVRWLNHHFGQGFAHAHALLGGCKHVVARKGAVLIDDSPTNCKKWKAKGGQAILFPAYGNKLYLHRDRGLDYIRPELERMKPTTVDHTTETRCFPALTWRGV